MSSSRYDPPEMRIRVLEEALAAAIRALNEIPNTKLSSIFFEGDYRDTTYKLLPCLEEVLNG